MTTCIWLAILIKLFRKVDEYIFKFKRYAGEYSMKKLLLLVLASMVFTTVEAQSIKEKSIDVALGLGVSAPFEDLNIANNGLYFQGEYVLLFSKWFDVRPYVGLIFTKSNGKDLNQNQTPYLATSNAVLVGGKGRVTIPIPWVAPYLELGIGTSFGSFKTITPMYSIDKTGIVYHIPFTIGLALGRNHNFDVSFTYYFQPTVEQFIGAAAVGVSIPIHN